MKRRNIAVVSILLLVVAAVPIMWNARFTPISMAGLVLNKFRTAHDPAGTLALELRESPTIEAAGSPSAQPDTNSADWPSYNRTLSADRFSPLDQINTRNVGALKVLCTYDTGVHESFETGAVVIDGTLIGTAVYDISSIDANTCREKWRTHEKYVSSTPLTVNRGVAFSAGRVFRGMLDGRVLAYDFKTGKRLSETTIADGSAGEAVDADSGQWKWRLKSNYPILSGLSHIDGHVRDAAA